MFDLECSFLNGRLLYKDDEKNFIGYDPIFSEPMDYPGDNNFEIERAEHNVLLDGEVFNVRIKQQRRGSIGGFGLLGLEVFLGGKHMTTYLGFSSMPDNSKYGSKWFYHNNSYYLIEGGWEFTTQKNDFLITSFDDVPMEKKYQEIDKRKLYLVKFKSFVGMKSYSQNKTIDEIITSLFVNKKTWSHALLKTLEAWNLKPFKRINTRRK